MKKIVKNILQRKELDKYLPEYGKEMSKSYYRFAGVCLAMNYFTLYEMANELEPDEVLNDITGKLVGLIDAALVKGELNDNISKDIEKIRNTVIENMKILTSYADIFTRYEYIINRIEYRFKSCDFMDRFSDEEFTRKIMRYIVSDEEPVVINGKIAEIIAELPMRMTKSKFFELLSSGIDIYKESDRKGLEDFLYMMRTSAMLDVPQDKNETFESLTEFHEFLISCDFDSITEEKYNELRNRLDEIADYLKDIVSIYMMLQQIINYVYAIIITKKYVDDYSEEEKVVKEILTHVSNGFIKGSMDVPEDVINDYFISLEGKQEMIHESYMPYEHALDEIKVNYQKELEQTEFEELFDVLAKDEVLLSDSLFVELDGNTDGAEEMTPEIFENIKKEFLEEIEKFFREHKRTVNRSVMSSIIASLPVFFNNIQELQDYVYNSLETCRQQAEKAACVEIINSIIEESRVYRKEE